MIMILFVVARMLFVEISLKAFRIVLISLFVNKETYGTCNKNLIHEKAKTRR